MIEAITRWREDNRARARMRRVFDVHMSEIFNYFVCAVGAEDAERLTHGTLALWGGTFSHHEGCLGTAKLDCMRIARKAAQMHWMGHVDEEMAAAVSDYDQLGLPEVEVEINSDLAQAIRALEKVSRCDREFLTLRLIVGLSLEEVASIVDLTSGQSPEAYQLQAITNFREANSDIDFNNSG